MTEEEISSIHLGEPIGYCFPWGESPTKFFAHDKQGAIARAQDLFIQHFGARGDLVEVHDWDEGWDVDLMLTPECDTKCLNGWNPGKACLSICVRKLYGVTA